MKDPVAAYLGGYAEPEARACARAMQAHGRFEQCLVIPAMGEGPLLMRALASVREADTLVILVVNARADAEPWVHRRNRRIPALLADAYGPGIVLDACESTPSLPRMALYARPSGAILLVHRGEAEHFLPPREGVGLARKIGTDMALALHVAGVLASPWIGTTDADVVLPPDYFTLLRRLPDDAAAATFRFFHGPEADPARNEAIVHYEAGLRYYVQGLRWAGSPYAFHTVGSTLAVHAAAYARVRGFPKLLAAEDFYLLDKLRKVGRVVTLGGSALMLSGRASPRVPFGTGRAMLRAMAQRTEPPVYHPHVFLYLRAFLERLNAAAEIPARASVTPAPLPLPLQADVLEHVTADLGTLQAVARAHAGTRSPEPRRRFLHTWFDAFRTLKLVHHLREHALPSVPLCEAVAGAPFHVEAETPADVLAELARREQGSYDSSHADALARF